jgi:hypothetical protein
VLTDTIDRGYDTVFSDAYAQSDVVITPQEGFGQEQAGAGGFRPPSCRTYRDCPWWTPRRAPSSTRLA